jgi:DNA-binding IclR family transcriptional regulator
MVSSDESLSLMEISKASGLGKGNVHRILDTLRANGYVRQESSTRKYGIGVKMIELGSRIKLEAFLRSIVLAPLKEVFEQCSETVNAAVLEANQIKYIVRLEPEHYLRVSINEGTRFPAHTTAIGKVLLSMLSDEELQDIYPSTDALKKLAHGSYVSLNAVLKEIRKVRRTGLAYDYEATIQGVHCVAVPIRNLPNGTHVAIGISGPKERMTPNRIAEHSKLLVQAADYISDRFSEI